MANIEQLIASVALMLEDRPPPTEGSLRRLVEAQADMLSANPELTGAAELTPEEVTTAVLTLMTRFSIHMEMGSLFKGKNYKPWLASRQGQIDWYYWKRYKKNLLKEGFPAHVVNTLDLLTDKIIDHLEDPLKEGSWARKGMVVGHVQSGKTANYAGLVCKAADAGYRVIIILAGTLNSLRNQTQERIDADFIGWCTHERKHIGASTFGNTRRPVCLTTSIEDFNKQTANSIALGLGALKEPVVLVVKKNRSTLQNLHSWLKDNNPANLQAFPMLLIDDEADHASINTNRDDTNPTAINLAIRNLLSLFSRSSFIGYTATPFANIFIDPETESEMESGELYKDLFPRDFILSLDPPDNYVGPHRLFMEGADLKCIRHIQDNEVAFPVRHKVNFLPEELPKSLEEAMCCFILAKALRILRGQVGKFHSMMVNASRFTNVQNVLAGLINDRLKQMKESIVNFAALPQHAALQNSDLKQLKQVFDREYGDMGYDWIQVQGKLRESADPIEILRLNVSSQDTLDYRRSNYPEGRTLIAIGGLGLSRGLTLQGLITSYFLRNSIMYDTLMQMGRWFGYRDGHDDLCRIFMTPAASSWYAHIADATEELRRDFKAMERARLTPKEFGLRVRSHPTALIVTARNKMRSGKKVPMQIALQGRLAETSVLLGAPESLEANRKLLAGLCARCEQEAGADSEPGLGHLWKSVSPSIVKATIEAFKNHPECMLTYPEPLAQYIDWLSSRGARFDVLLRSVLSKEQTYPVVAGIKVAPIERTVASMDNTRIEFSKRRVASKGDERAGLTEAQVNAVKAKFPGDTPPDKAYREVEGRSPLFMIMFAKVRIGGAASKDDPVVATYGISFPGDPGTSRHPEKLVEYVVNTTWWQQNYDPTEDDPEESE